MTTKLIQPLLVIGSLFMTVMVYVALIHYSKIAFTLPTMFLFIGIAGAYLYGATAFLAVKGIDLFPRSE